MCQCLLKVFVKKSHASFLLSTTFWYGADHSHLNPFSICWPTTPLPSCSSAVCLLDNRFSTCWGSSSPTRQAIVVMCRWYFFLFLSYFFSLWVHEQMKPQALICVVSGNLAANTMMWTLRCLTFIYNILSSVCSVVYSVLYYVVFVQANII